MASKLVSYVHTVQLKLKIEQATLPNSDDPPPPNVMEELCAAIGRDRKNVDDAIDCLEQRLQARSPAAKQKALKLVKYMSQRGSGELQRALVRLSAQIKELQTFRCAPDAFKGDIPWKRVQEYAREALEAIHRVREADASGVSSMASITSMSSVGKRMEGFGSGNTSASTSGNANGVGTNGSRGTNTPGSGGKQRYEGFGSGGARTSSCVLEPDAEDFRDASFGAKLAMGFNELKSAALSGAVRFGDFSGVVATRGGHAQDKTPTASDAYRSAYSPPTRPQIDVGAFGEHGLASPTATRNAMVPMAGGGFEGIASPSSTTSTTSASTSTPPATPEERLVHAFVSKTAHGVRVAPTVDECGKFLSTCGGHGSIPLAKAFEKKLTNGSWKEVLRALCVLDVAATGQGTSVTPAISSMVGYFKDHPASLQRASDSAQDRVRSKAASVMARLGIECASIDAGLGAADVSVDLLSVDGTSGGLPSLLEALDVNEGVEGIELPPNSPVAGLISATASPSAIGAVAAIGAQQRAHASTQSNPSDPFGDWLGGEQTTTSTATATATSTRTGTTVDPFAAMEDTRASPESSKSKKHQPILDDFFASSEASLGPPPAASGHGGQGADVLGAWHATTSGFTSSKREEAAFDFGDLRKI